MAIRLSCAALAAAWLAASTSAAQVPRLLGYQGRLLRSDGTAATGTASVTFAVFDAATNGSQLWSETQTLGLSDGYYATFLGLAQTVPDSVFDGSSRWLQVQVGAEPLLPRQQVGSVPQAVLAQSVRGGVADVSSVKILGSTVVDSGGRLAGNARYAAGAGIVIDPEQNVSLLDCSNGQTLAHDASTWTCVARNTGTVTSVSGSGAITVSDGSTTPQVSMLQATASTSGYVSSTDWSAFNQKFGTATQCGGDLSGPLSAPTVWRLQSRPVSPAQPGSGQVLKWNGAQWEPALDENSGGTLTQLVGHAPLTVQASATTPDISIDQASSSVDGYLGSADYAYFAQKFDSATACGGDLSGNLPSPRVVALQSMAISPLAPAPGQVLFFDGADWAPHSLSPQDAGALDPSAAPGGDLSGTNASPKVAKIQGISVATAAPADAQVLRYDGTTWTPATLALGDVTGLSSGYLDLTGTQTVAGAKTFASAPVFVSPLGVASGGIGADSAAAHAVFAGPVASSGAPAFRALESTDIPALDVSKITAGTLAVARGGTGTTAFAPGSVLFAGETGLSQDNAGLFWDATDRRLGIGTASPQYALHVSQSPVGDVLTVQTTTSSVYSPSAPNVALRFRSNLGGMTDTARITAGLADTYQNGGGRLGLQVISSTGTWLEALSATASGNVGIGTTNPGSKLSVRADGYTSTLGIGGSITDNVGYLSFYSNAAPNRRFRIGGIDGVEVGTGADTAFSEKVRIDAGGNVGIGTTSPQRLLHAAVAATDGVSGDTLDSYGIAQFKVNGSGGGMRGLEVGAPTGSVTSPVYLKVHGTGNRLAVLDQYNSENFTVLEGGGAGVVGRVGVGTSSPDAGTRMTVLQSTAGNDVLHLTNSASNAVLGLVAAGSSYGSYVDSQTVGSPLKLRVSKTSASDTNAITISAGSTTAGYVGIGTTTPGILLSVAGPTNGSSIGFEPYTYFGSAYSSAALLMGNMVRPVIGSGGYVKSTGITIAQAAIEINAGVISFATKAQDANAAGTTWDMAANTKMTIANGGSVGIGTTAPAAGAILELASTTKALLPPRMTKTQRDAIPSGNLVAGMVVYNTDDNQLNMYNGTSWGDTKGGPAYIKLSMSNYQGPGYLCNCSNPTGTQIRFDTQNYASKLTTSSWGVNLKAGKTYRLESSVNLYSPSGNQYLGYAFYTSGGTQIGTGCYTQWFGSSAAAYGFKSECREFYTPSVDTNVIVKINDGNIGSGFISPNYNTYFIAWEI